MKRATAGLQKPESRFKDKTATLANDDEGGLADVDNSAAGGFFGEPTYQEADDMDEQFELNE